MGGAAEGVGVNLLARRRHLLERVVAGAATGADGGAEPPREDHVRKTAERVGERTLGGEGGARAAGGGRAAGRRDA